jgi:hypothetical protein
MSRLSMDPELDDLERRRNHLLRKDRREALRREVEELERRTERKELSSKRVTEDVSSKMWEKRGIMVTDMRKRK